MAEIERAALTRLMLLTLLTALTALTPPGGPLLDRVDAAQYLGASERWVKRAIAERRLPTIKIGRQVRISVAALDQLIASGSRPASGAS